MTLQDVAQLCAALVIASAVAFVIAAGFAR